MSTNVAAFARKLALAFGALALLATTFSGCKNESAVKSSRTAQLSILALGDSYTIGEGVDERERWPMQLAEKLRRSGDSVASPTIIARTGWTMDDLQAALDRAAPPGPFDLVTLLIGVNDQFRGREAEQAREPFRKLLQSAIKLAGNQPSRVLVLSIPDWGVTPFAAEANPPAISAAIDRFNRMEQEEATRAGAHFQDVTGISREAKADASLLAADQLHPSAKMYGLWVDAVLPRTMEMLKK